MPPVVTVVKVQIPCAFEWIAGKQVSVVRQVGGNLDDLVTITFLQQKFKAWAVPDAARKNEIRWDQTLIMYHCHPLFGFIHIEIRDVAP